VRQPEQAQHHSTVGSHLEEIPFHELNDGSPIQVNLKHPKGLEIIHKLAVESDVVIENYLPGKLDAMGLGYETLKKINNRLIYCSITGYGQDGPYAHRPGYDAIIAAELGFFHITGPRDGPPCKVGVKRSFFLFFLQPQK
jgi:succinate--hydroxymethylglutarate CoA-transferase